MKIEIGTLKELDVKPGDVVEFVYGGKNNPDERGDGSTGIVDQFGGVTINSKFGHFTNGYDAKFRIISRAPRNHKTWGEMTDAEKGALLLAEHEGKSIMQLVGAQWVFKINHHPWNSDTAYRVHPDPKSETVTWYVAGKYMPTSIRCNGDTHRITFDIIDGELDADTIRMDRI